MSETHEEVDAETVPINQLDIWPNTGHPVTVVVIGTGEDEEAAMEAVALACGTWEAKHREAEAGDEQLVELMGEDNAVLIGVPHYTFAWQFRRIRHDIPTMSEEAMAAHIAAGGSPLPSMDAPPDGD